MNNLVLTLTDKTTYLDIITAIDAGGVGFLAIVDRDYKLIGIATDADIRKAILNGKSQIEDIINKKPVTWSNEKNKSGAILYLKKLKLRHLPVVTNENKLVDIICLDNIDFNIKTTPVIIMAGGLGMRLRPLTEKKPKPMLNIGSQPLLEILIQDLIYYGFVNIYISVNYLSNQIKEYFKDGSKFGANIKYIEEREKLGTAGSISLIKDEINEPFIVMNGDVISGINFEEFYEYHLKSENTATMCIKKMVQKLEYGQICILDDGQIEKIVEKPENSFFINAGIYILNREVLMLIPDRKYYNITTLFETLIENEKKTGTYEIKSFWLDIGKESDYRRACSEFNEKI